jgi:chromosome segregation ATPase
MTGAIGGDQVAILSLIMAVNDDEVKQARAKELLDLIAKLKAETDKAESVQRDAEAKLREAAKTLAQVRAIEATNAAKELELQSEKDHLGDQIASLNEEKGKFEGVREAATKQHDAREEAVSQREKDAADKAKELDRREAKVAEREAIADKLHETLQARHQVFRDALDRIDEMDAPPEPEKE